jgi:hypothetical protein
MNAQAHRLDTIMRLQAQLLAQVQAWSQPDTPAPAPASPVPRRRYPVGHFGERHGLTPAQAYLANELLRQKKPFRGPHAQQREAARIRGIINAVKKGYVGNHRWGRSMLGKVGGKAMAMHGLHHLRAIAHLGGEAKRDKSRKHHATAHWEQTGQALPLQPKETGGHHIPQVDAWTQWQAAHMPLMLW